MAGLHVAGLGSALVLCSGVVCHAATPSIIVPGGGEEALSGDLAAEFTVLPPGQQFPFVAVTSGAAQEGFLNNDCTFGVLPNCGWSPLGASTSVDFSISIIPLSHAQIQAYEQSTNLAEGPPIQFPLYGVGVAIGVVNAGLSGNGKLILGDGELCGILSGQITDWSQFSYLAAPGPFQIVYDSNPGSGMTWLLTQHLNAVCDASNSAFTTLPVPVTGNFASLPVPGGVAGNAHFVAAAGNAAIAKALLASNSALGYLAPAFTSIAAKSPTTTTVSVASLYNSAAAAAYTPTAANILSALQSPGANATNAQPPGNPNAAADPTRWVPQFPTPGAGYPIVGYASWILSTCYLSNAAPILQYLTQPTDPAKHAQEAALSDLVPLATASAAYSTAVNNILLSNVSGYNLQIQNPVACSGRAILSPGQGGRQ